MFLLFWLLDSRHIPIPFPVLFGLSQVCYDFLCVNHVTHRKCVEWNIECWEAIHTCLQNRTIILFKVTVHFIWSLTESESKEKVREWEGNERTWLYFKTMSDSHNVDFHQLTVPMIPRYFTKSSNYIFCFHCFEWQISSGRSKRHAISMQHRYKWMWYLFCFINQTGEQDSGEWVTSVIKFTQKVDSIITKAPQKSLLCALSGNMKKIQEFRFNAMMLPELSLLSAAPSICLWKKL